MAAKRQSGRRALTAAEAWLWRETMRDVIPFRDDADANAGSEASAAAAPAIAAPAPTPTPAPAQPPARPLIAPGQPAAIPAVIRSPLGFPRSVPAGGAVGSDLEPNDNGRSLAEALSDAGIGANGGTGEPGWTLTTTHEAAPGAGAGAGVGAGIDRRTDLRLRRGRLSIDGRIDLHGMTQSQAHGALAGFLHRCRQEERRCVLVITGKGTGRGGEGSLTGGVLRAALPRWLAEPPLRDLVVTLHPAQPRDGGDGAFYVLLKRQRR